MIIRIFKSVVQPISVISRVVFILIFLFVLILGQGQTQLSIYKNLTTAYGLPSNYITKIEFDTEGFLWMISPKGLTKYDGNNYKLVIDSRENNKLSSEEIQDFCIIKDHIWYFTKEGKLFSFNKNNCFIKAYPLENAFPNKTEKLELSSIYADSDQKIWLSVLGFGVLIIDTKTNKEDHIYHQSDHLNALTSNNITDVYQAERNVFLLASDKGFSIYNTLDNTFQNFSNTPENPNLLLSNDIKTISKDINGNIWLGSCGSGLSRFNTGSLKRHDFIYDEKLPTSISNNYIHDLFIDNKNMLWISTYNGLNVIDINSNTLVLKYQKNNNAGLGSNNINNTVQSDMGNIWVALNGGGISIIQNSEPKFINKKFRTTQQQYAGTPITDIETDNDDCIWFLSPNDGVMIYTHQGKYLSDLSTAINDEIKTNKLQVDGLYIKNNKLFLLGGDGRLLYMTLSSNDNHFSTIDLQMDVKQLKCVFYDHGSNLWILSERGAFCYDKTNRIIDSIKTNSVSNCMIQDYRGDLWIGTVGDGLWVYNLITKEKKQYHSAIGTSGLVGDNISYLYEDNIGVMWIGTLDGGLCKFNRNVEKFIPFAYNNSIMSSEVFSIIEDDMDNLWVASEYGLIKIDEINYKFSLFGLGQGLTRNQYIPKAVLKDEHGYLYFGTESGLLSFDPINLALKKEFPELKFTDFFVFNESIFSLDDTLKKNDFTINSTVYLQAKDNYIGIEYAALNLDHSQKIQYKYRLFGIEDEWIYCRNNNFVSYLNIPSGSYIFQLMSTNVDGVWNERMKELKIEITPPFYLTTWFLIVSLLLFFLVVITVVYYRIKFQKNITHQLERNVNEKTRQLNESNRRLKEEVEERRLAEESADSANRTKGLFLANMSHEIRTPMNSIIGFADLLSSLVQDKKQRTYLDSIIKSGRSLLLLINDILDLSKIDSGSFNIEYQPVNLVELLNEIHQIFILKCDEKDLIININMDSEIPKYLILSDARLRQVLINIVGNAVKFTDIGSINIQAIQIDSDTDPLKKNIRIDVVDTGVGIAENQQMKIFEVFQQQEGQEFSKYGGTGLGLNISKKLMELMGGEIQVTSKENEGTCFSLLLNDVPVFTEPINDIKERVSLLQMDLSEYTLLIVDDSAANRHLIMEYLAPSGAKIIEAGNGQQAYEKAQELLPSIIFLDIRMPVMDGFETAEALKIYPPTRDIPLVAFTANVSFDSEDKYQEVGFEHVLLKPIDFEKLGDILQDLLKIDSVIEEQRITETIIENNGFENIQIIDLRKAYKELASLMEEWEQVKDNKFVNVILEFGSKIIGIGERYSVDAIITYGKQLQANAYSFDTEKIEQDLSLFPSLINELNSYLND